MTDRDSLDPTRVARAATALAEGRVQMQPAAEPGTWRVASFTRPDVSYTVHLERRECSCPDSLYRGELCKHLASVALTRGLT